MMPLILFGLMQILVDAALWGIAAYLVFVLISPAQTRYHAAAWVSAGVYFLWHEVVASRVLAGVAVRFANPDISQLASDDLTQIHFFDVLLSIALAYGGFFLGRYLFCRALAEVQNASSGVVPVPASPMQFESRPESQDERIGDMPEHQDRPVPASDPEPLATAVDAQPNPNKKNGLAIASLVCGIIGGWASTISIPAVICGHLALSKVKNNPEEYSGRGIAIAGLVLGYLGLALGIVGGIVRATLQGELDRMGY